MLSNSLILWFITVNNKAHRSVLFCTILIQFMLSNYAYSLCSYIIQFYILNGFFPQNFLSEML